MIIFTTLWGSKIEIRSSAEQREFEIAIKRDPRNAIFHVGAKSYFTRSITGWTSRSYRGPYKRRIRFTML
jgi:hypothetical protein